MMSSREKKHARQWKNTSSFFAGKGNEGNKDFLCFYYLQSYPLQSGCSRFGPHCAKLEHNHLQRAILGAVNKNPNAQLSPLSPPYHKTPNPFLLPLALAKLSSLPESSTHQSLKTLSPASIFRTFNNREIEEQLSQLCKGDYSKG